MSSNTIYHYVYRITNLIEGKHYYGTRTTKVHPSKDLGKRYFSSSSDKDFKKDQKENPQNYKYKVIKIFDTREEAVEMEIKLHDMFDVGMSKSFYNRSKQTNTKFDTTGMMLHDEELYEFVHKDGTSRTDTFRGMAEFLGSTHIYGLKSQYNSSYGWSLLGRKKHVIPHNIETIINELRFHFYNPKEDITEITTPSTLMSKYGMKKYPLIYLITGRKKNYKGFWLIENYKKVKEPDSKEPSKADTEFLFKRMSDGFEISCTPREMENKYGVSIGECLTIISGGSKSARGWCMGWYQPYPEKLEGNHNKYNNKDTRSYELFDIVNECDVSMTRDQLKEYFGYSEAAISVFISGKVKVIGGTFCLRENKGTVGKSNKIETSYTFKNVDGREFTGSVMNFCKTFQISKNVAYPLTKNPRKSKSGWFLGEFEELIPR